MKSKKEQKQVLHKAHVSSSSANTEAQLRLCRFKLQKYRAIQKLIFLEGVEAKIKSTQQEMKRLLKLKHYCC